MEISLKVQNIGANYNPEAKDIVITHEFSVPSEQLLSKRGRLFITLKLSASGDFDLKDATTLFLDSVQENFYRLTDETPLHSLEKALNRAIKLVLTIKSQDESLSLGSVEANFKLNFATALVWNRVLYTSYLGTPAVYLVRGTGVRNLSMNPAVNEIWTNSGILDDQDVIVIGTDTFAKNFSASNIIASLGNISQTIANHPAKDELAALLIKVTTSEKQSSASTKASPFKFKDTIYSSFWSLKSKFAENEKLSDRFKIYQNKKTAPVSSISGLTTPASATTSINMPKGPKRMSTAQKSSKKTRKRVAVGVGMIALATFGAYQLFLKPENHPIANDIEIKISSKPSGEAVMGVSTSAEETNTKPVAELYPAYIDLKTIKDDIVPIGLSTTLTKVTVLDATSNSVYSIDKTTKASNSLFKESSMPQFMKCDSKLCYVVDSDKLYVFDPEKPEKVDKYLHELNGITDIYPYGNIVYMIDDTNIYALTLDTDAPKKWLAEDQKLQNAKSIAVDGNIYVLSGNTVRKFYNSKEVNGFTFDTTKVTSPLSIEVYNGKLYVLDVSADSKTLNIFNKNTGAFLQSVELTKDVVMPKYFALPHFDSSKFLFEKDKILYEVKF